MSGSVSSATKATEHAHGAPPGDIVSARSAGQRVSHSSASREMRARRAGTALSRTRTSPAVRTLHSGPLSIGIAPCSSRRPAISRAQPHRVRSHISEGISGSATGPEARPDDRRVRISRRRDLRENASLALLVGRTARRARLVEGGSGSAASESSLGAGKNLQCGQLLLSRRGPDSTWAVCSAAIAAARAGCRYMPCATTLHRDAASFRWQRP